MKITLFAIAAAAGLTAFAPAAAQVPGSAGAAETVNPDAAAQDKVICRSTTTIGSRLKPTKVCKTARQWEADQMEQRRTVEKGQNQRTLRGN